MRSIGFPPLEPLPGSAHVLVLGSLPGRESLAQQKYYAHPHNAFWRLMGEICGAAPNLPYRKRVQVLLENGIAVWDVLYRAHRPGSLDSSIRRDSEVANDFATFFSRQTQLALIAFNGASAAALFCRHVLPALATPAQQIARITLPSTSPAHAALRYEYKLARWRDALAPQLLNFARKAP